jgi:hypothetical protein
VEQVQTEIGKESVFGQHQAAKAAVRGPLAVAPALRDDCAITLKQVASHDDCNP